MNNQSICKKKKRSISYVSNIGGHNEVCLISKAVLVDGEMTYMLFHTNGELIYEAFTYINSFLMNGTESNREKINTSLKYLYSYLELRSINIKDFTFRDTKRFISFLKGGNLTKNGTYDQGLEISNQSVREYLSRIRDYISYLGYKENPLLAKIKVINNANKLKQSEKYKISVKQFPRQLPKYITFEQYKRIAEYFKNNNNITMLCIIMLAYESGLRLGEILSLTIEDLKTDCDYDGEIIRKVIIRNRYSTNKKISCKNLIHINDKSEYDRKEYRTKGVGFDEQIISEELFNLLKEHFQSSIPSSRASYNKWSKNLKADAVDGDMQNFYIFCNEDFRRTRQKTVNNSLKEAYDACGIEYEGLTSNIAHMLRHGFAMYLLLVKHYTIENISLLMRHRSINSTLIYLTPDIKAIYKIKNANSEEYMPYVESVLNELD